jgi:hypothetical protein
MVGFSDMIFVGAIEEVGVPAVQALRIITHNKRFVCVLRAWKSPDKDFHAQKP